MSPNGRRAWREWVRRQDLRRKHKQPKGSVCRMARQARRHIPLVPGAVLPKPPTTRSLVGMTMGARKRVLQDELSRYIGDDNFDYGDVVAHFADPLRIGERLRPCPGCFDCAVECWVCHEPHEPPDELCGGSGVIRAGKLRPLLRKPDCGFYID